MTGAFTPDPTIRLTYGGDRGMELVYFSEQDGRQVNDMAVLNNYHYFVSLSQHQAAEIVRLKGKNNDHKR